MFILEPTSGAVYTPAFAGIVGVQLADGWTGPYGFATPDTDDGYWAVDQGEAVQLTSLGSFEVL
jgi:hypothetical protein